MSENQNSITIKCDSCGADMLVDENAVSIYCLKCQNWTQIKKGSDTKN